MNQYLNTIGYFGTDTAKVRARRIHQNMQMIMNPMDSGKEDEP